MRTLISALVVLAFLCDFSKGRSEDVILFDQVQTAITKIELLSEQLQELQEEFREGLRGLQGELLGLQGEFAVLKDGQNSMYDEVEGVHVKLGAMKRQMAERCTRQDNLLRIIQGLIEMEVARGEAIVRLTCSASQLTSLQDSLLTEMNVQGETSKEEMANMETRIMKAIECLPPSGYIAGFGCITAFNELKTWEDARDHCKAQVSGTRLLEGITSQQEMDLLKERFLDSFQRSGDPWIGLRANPSWAWDESGGSVDIPSSPSSPSSSSSSSSSSSAALWEKGEPDDGDNGCGVICLKCYPRTSLLDYPCGYVQPFFCQRI